MIAGYFEKLDISESSKLAYLFENKEQEKMKAPIRA